jgi:hypothetical protein
VLATPTPRHMTDVGLSRSRGRVPYSSATPSGVSAGSTPEGSLSSHTLASPPPPPSPRERRGDPRRRHRFELQVIPRVMAISEAEEALSSTLVAIVAGT